MIARSTEAAGSLTSSTELSRVSIDVLGRELALSSGQVHRPSAHARGALFSLIEAARCVARATPQVFASEEASRAL